MLRSHLKLAWKVLLRRKVFTAISLVGISLTLVVLTVAAAMIDGVIAPRPPETRLDRTLGIYAMGLIGEHWRRTGFAGYGFLDRYARDLPGVEEESFTSVARPVVSYVEGRRVRSYLKLADAAFWRVLDFEFLEGGPFAEEEVEAGSRVAVINRATRGRFFGSGPAVGRPIEVDGRRFRVVGVVDDVPLVRLAAFADVWIPLTAARNHGFRDEFVGEFFGLLLARDRAAFPAIKAEVASRFASAQLPDPEQFDRVVGGADTPLEGVARFVSSDPSASRPQTLIAILAAAAFAFMLLPAINLVNINLSRILERAGEIGVRKAFGASSRTLVGQFLVENLLLTLLGGLIGLAVSALALAAINHSGLIPYADFTVNLRVFAWGMALAAVFGLLSGVYPAWRMSRLNPAEALGGRS